MEALKDLIWVCKVESRTWNDVINMPPIAMILPCHARLEFGFKVAPQLFHTTSNQLSSAISFSLNSANI